MADTVDLHLHSDYSDGTIGVADLLALIRQKDLSAFALCDHDNIDGYKAMRKLLREDDPQLVPGVELSANAGDDDIHILGYYFDPESALLNEALAEFRKRRNVRGAEMLKRLEKQGINLTLDTVLQIAGKSAIGRPHVAEALLRKGFVSNFDEAFHRYIGRDRPCYVPKQNLALREAVDLIHQAGGVAVLAHPGIGGAGRYIEELVGYSLDGIEAFHPFHSSRLIKNYQEYAAKNGLFVTGGSDYHGRNGRYGDIGCMNVPVEFWHSLRKKAKNIN